MADDRVVIVGAGPAGVRAAEVLAAPGIRPVVIDENPAPGGQIYRQPPAGFQRGYRELYGIEAGKARRLHRTFAELAETVDYRPSTLAWNVYDKILYVVRDGVHDRIPFDALILAPGAADLVLPFPGWTNPGVYTLGGAQIALKHQGCAVGRETIFLGTGPLLYLVAYQYAKAGAKVAAVLDTSPLEDRLRALPGLIIGGLALAKGVYYMGWLKSKGIPLLSGVRPLRVEGDGRIEALVCRDSQRRDFAVAGDAVAFGFGLRSECQLADLARCEFYFDERLRQWLPKADEDGSTTTDGVYIAGDGRRVAGAEAAESAGALAAFAVLIDRGYPVTLGTHRFWRARVTALDGFRKGLEEAFPPPLTLARAASDDTVVCRCENVSAGTLRAAARDLGATEINRAKALTRLGMGRCQGRYCALAAAEILAEALDLPVEDVGRLRAQAPVKPLGLAEAQEP
ncbi:MAG: NAD(P)/FAD-dependent oxidoreductase [Alphaproteobacteria bacterium]|jgi:NADPH-dependent 2,4-dienoyl-CoA reductase/sulfur reductase-like enzyme|nr:NAD(P)/FAD-dependent oxidoreductase [Alphaproteobacteria bacterium]